MDEQWAVGQRDFSIRVSLVTGKNWTSSSFCPKVHRRIRDPKSHCIVRECKGKRALLNVMKETSCTLLLPQRKTADLIAEKRGFSAMLRKRPKNGCRLCFQNKSTFSP